MPNSDLFKQEESYMFYFAHARGTCLPGVIVEKPTTIWDDQILFHFLVGYKSEGEWVKKKEILAIGDSDLGTVEICGWSGKYRILNEELFSKYVKDGVIKLKTN